MRAAALLPGFFIVVGPHERLVIVADTLGMPGAMRFRTRLHAEAVLEKILADGGLVVRDFGPGAIAS